MSDGAVVDIKKVPMKKFSEILKTKQEDLRYMRQMKKTYEDAYGDGAENNSEYIKIANKVFVLEKAAEKEAARIQAEVDKLEAARDGADANKFEAAVVEWVSKLESEEIFFVADENKFYQYFKDEGGWTNVGVDAMFRYYGAAGAFEKAAMDEALTRCSRKKMRALYSFKEQPERVLNLMKTEHWLQPVKGQKYSEVFDILLDSLSDGRQDVRDHIEQVIYWKHKNPADYKLPCLIIYGEGGVGKNELTNDVMRTIFGQQQANAVKFDDVFGQFSGLTKGSVFTYIDEVVSDKADAERMKSIVGNEYISVNNKGGKQEKGVPNTSLFMVGGNDHTGALILDNSSADRRWSIIKVRRSIIQHTQEKYDLDDFNEALELYSKMRKSLSDPRQCEAWLGYLYEKWDGKLDGTPDGYRGEDYKNLIETQRSPLDDFCHRVFDDESFEAISGKTFFEALKMFVKEVHPAAGHYVKGRNKALAAARDWVEKHKGDEVVWGKYHIGRLTLNGPMGETTFTKEKMTSGFYINGKSTFENTDERYVEETHSTSQPYRLTKEMLDVID